MLKETVQLTAMYHVSYKRSFKQGKTSICKQLFFLNDNNNWGDPLCFHFLSFK